MLIERGDDETLLLLYDETGDINGLARLRERGVRGAGSLLYMRLADAGDVQQLMTIARQTPADAEDVAWELSRIGAVAELRELVDAGVDSGGKLVARAVGATGDLAAVRALVESAPDANVARDIVVTAAQTVKGPTRPLWEMLDAAWPGGAPPRPIIAATAEWVGLAVASGVLSNAAYDGLIKSARALWTRGRAEPSSAPPSLPGPHAERPGPRTEREAFTLAFIAVDEHCRAAGLRPPDLERAEYEALLGVDGRWVFAIAGDRKRFTVRVPAAGGADENVLVTIYLRR